MKPRFRFDHNRLQWRSLDYPGKRICQCDICHGPAVKHGKSALCKTCSDARVAEIKKARRLFLYACNYHYFPKVYAQTLKCNDCQKFATEWEHRDWREPLKVEPVCRGCNARRGRAMTAYEASFRGLPPHRSLVEVRREFDARIDACQAAGFKTFGAGRTPFCAPQTSLATRLHLDSARQVVGTPSHTTSHIHVGNA